MSSKQNKLFGKYHEIMLLFFGFVFSTLFGGAMTYFYQSLERNQSLDLMEKKEQRIEKMKFYEDFSTNINLRIYYPYRIKSAIEQRLNVSEEKKRWNEYDVVLKNWSSQQMNYEIKLDLYFNHIRNYYDDSIHISLRNYHTSIYRIDSLYNAQPEYRHQDFINLFNDFEFYRAQLNYQVKKLNKMVYQSIYNIPS